MNFYGEISIHVNNGERYFFPTIIERDTSEDAAASLQKLADSLEGTSESATVAKNPIPIDGWLEKHIEFRVRNHLGHVRAGTLRISEFELVDAVDYDGESLTFKQNQDGRYLLALKERSYPLFRLLANSQSKQEGEAFVIALPLGEEIGPMSPIFEAYPELEAEHQLNKARGTDDA